MKRLILFWCKSILLTCFVLMIVNIVCYSQELEMQQVIPSTSPTASSLGKYIDYPVSLNNGLPDITIPLYELQSSRLSVPISLSYHASGIRVTDRTTTMGLGWTLNAGGAIMRTVRGLPDNSRWGFLNWIFPEGGSALNRYYKEYCIANYLYNHYTPEQPRDGEPDIYFYNFMNKGGKFVFRNKLYLKDEPVALTMPYDPIKIKYREGNAKQIAPFSIIDENGVTYEFGKDYREAGGQMLFATGNALDYSQNDDAPANVKTVVNAWYLTSIISADKTDTIFFKYAYNQGGYSYSQTSTSMVIERGILNFGLPVPQMSRHSSMIGVGTARITEIQSKTGKLFFNYSAVGQPVLQSIDVYNNQGQKIRSFGLFTSNFASTIANAPNRLRLDSLTETGYNGGITVNKAPHKFLYNTNDVPPYNTNSRDLWGYYNGFSLSLDNDHLLMADNVYDALEHVFKAKITPEKRAGNPDFMSKAMLRRIVYPTGGFTDFNFEPNQTKAMVPVLIPGRELSAAYVSTMNMVPNSTQGIDVTFTPSPNGGGKARLNFSGSKTCTPGVGGCFAQRPRVELIDVTTGQTVLYNTLSGLESGQQTSENYSAIIDVNITHTYRLRLADPGSMTSSSQTPMYRMSATYYDFEADRYEDQLQTVYTGGHRIKKIINDDGTGNTTIKEYDYTKSYFNSNAFNGTLDFVLKNTTQLKFIHTKSGDMTATYYSEFPSVPIGGATNSALSYEEVTESMKDPSGKKLGKTVYTFNKGIDEIPPRLPYVRQDREYVRKQLLDTKIYSVDANDNYTLVKEIQNTYKNENDDGFESWGRDSVMFYVITSDCDYKRFVAGGGDLSSSVFGTPKSMGCQIFQNSLEYRVDRLYYHCHRSTLLSTKEMNYAPGSVEPLVTEVSYSYDNPAHLLPTKITSTGSSLETKEQFFKYVGDMKYESCFPGSCQANLDQQLAQLSQTRETCQQRAIDANDFDGYDRCQVDYEAALSLKIADFNACNLVQQQAYLNCRNSLPENDKALLTMQEINQISPVVEVQNKRRSKNIEKKILSYKVINSSQGVVRPAEIFREIGDNPRESYVKYNQYDADGNIQEQCETGNINEVYIWGYDNRYPVAKIIGTTFNTAMSYLNPAILRKPSSDQQLRDELNILRSKLPAGSTMVTSYTYAPMIGITSETDPSGKTIFYEYDGLGRLKLIKDQNGKILKQFDYRYQQAN
ncbi:RHS repeat domain-containing protein [Chitinophaga polysaccharea]|uniref:RHS repeat domain-containing protein n=1 Tax=Chitinophaga polysaccharea TaxID=1293035 RepID=UPI00115C1E5A|nr:RHS repeat domain-containing protein [Chitinophaga polysaccharea]